VYECPEIRPGISEIRPEIPEIPVHSKIPVLPKILVIFDTDLKYLKFGVKSLKSLKSDLESLKSGMKSMT